MTETKAIYRPQAPIFPNLSLEPECYASLKMRLDLYDDLIFATKYDGGRPGATFAVDPLDLAMILGDWTVSSGFLPPNCLFWSKTGGVERLGIYVKPGIWAVSVRGHKHTWHIPLPGFVCLGQGTDYRLYAVKLPPATPAAVLYNFPAPNVAHDNGVCTGNAPFPVASRGTIWDAVHVFFESEFNQLLVGGKSLENPADILIAWQALDEAGATVYPAGDLVEHGHTLAGVI